MLEGTRIVQIYFRYDGPKNARFGEEIDDRAVNDHAYEGWLPLALSPAEDNDRRHVTLIGDPWLTTPAGADAPPDPGPPPVRITATECSDELEARARVGLNYFSGETPVECGTRYDRREIARQISEAVRAIGKTLEENLAVRTAFRNPDVKALDVLIATVKCMPAAGKLKTDLPACNETCHSTVADFIATHHHELVGHVDQRIRDNRARLRGLMNAARRLRAFDD